MRTINLRISLEDYCSRLPGVIPAYEGDNLYYFDKDSLLADYYRHKSNYGMFPLNLVLSGITYTNGTLAPITDWTACGIADLQDNQGDCSTFVKLSWNHISDILAFFRKYYSLLNDSGSCGLAYSSATEYYKTESKGKFDASLIYGNEEDTYTAMDEQFLCYGGCLSACTDIADVHEDYGMASGDEHHPIVYVLDNGFFKWLCDNVVPAFAIPVEYIDAYDNRLLYYPDAVKWCNWLRRMGQKYTGETIDCSEYIDSTNDKNCCECEKYLEMGGADMFAKLSAWLEQINTTITANNAIIHSNKENGFMCQEPHIFNNISLLNSVEDLGELSIFSEEWEGGVDYAPNTEYSKPSGGTVVIYDNNAYIIHNENSRLDVTLQNKNNANPYYGYKYDDRLCKYVWGNDSACTYIQSIEENQYKLDNTQHWEDYVKTHLNAHREDFRANMVSYTYDQNKRLVANPTPLLMAQTIPVDTNNGLGYIVHEGQHYPIFQNECVVYASSSSPYLNGKVFIVRREKDTNTPYVELNGRKVYATFDEYGQYKFFFNPTTLFDKKNIDDANVKQFAVIGNTTYPVSSGRISYTFGGYTQTYNKVDGWFIYNQITHYVLNGNVVSSVPNFIGDGEIENVFTNEMYWNKESITTLSDNSGFQDNNFYYQYINDNNTILITENYVSYPVQYITGVSSSLLSAVKREILYHDDLGNVLDGFYEVSTASTYAQPSEGTVLKPYYNVGNTTSKKESYTENGITYYVGNIIESMTFYYLNMDGTHNETFMKTCSLDSGDRDSLHAIQELEEAYTTNLESDNPVVLDNILYCDIKYNIGATVYFTPQIGWSINNKAHRGVEYQETVIFTKQQEQYYVSEDRSYNVFCYILGQELETFNSSDYGITITNPQAMFKMQIMTFVDELDGEIFTSVNGFVNNNGLMIAPVFRQEYMLNVAVPEYIETNINIDRGVNSAFEKHIKLGEVASFEALENYGNGFFNMLDS